MGWLGDVAKGLAGGIAGDLIGGLFGKSGAEEQAAAIRQQAEMNYAAQKEFAQQGIRWKVADAKAAGVHPVYALGGSGASYAPNPVVVGDNWQGEMGRNIGASISRSVAAQETEAQRQDRVMNHALMASQMAKNDAERSYAEALAAKVAQEMMFAKPMPGSAGSMVISSPGGWMEQVPSLVTDASNVPGDAFEKIAVKPAEVTSQRFGDMATTAGSPPAGTEFVFSDRPGREPVHAWLPQAENVGESIEGLSFWNPMAWPFIAENIRRYGWSWPRKMIFGGDYRGPTVSGRIRR